jgi:anti-repressor protein
VNTLKARVSIRHNNRDALARLDDDEKGTCIVPTLGGNQSLLTVNESESYSPALTNRKATENVFLTP